MIDDLSVRTLDGGGAIIDFTTLASGDKLAKPKEIIALLGLDAGATRVIKRETLLADAFATA
jgi:hypothetical protein